MNKEIPYSKQNSITIDELLKYRIDLEKDLLEVISREVRAFERKTGVGVSGINIHQIDSTSIGSTRKQLQITDITVSLELEEE